MAGLDNETSFAELEDLFSEYMEKADNTEDILQKGADAFVKDLRALPSPRSSIAKAGYTHLIDSFASQPEGKDVLIGWGKYYGPILEHGSRKMRPREHFKPLWNRNKERYYRTMIEEFHGR